MSKVKATIVKGTENVFKLALSVDGVLQNHTGITSAELRTSLGKTVASSVTDPTDWSFANAGYLTVKLGLTDLTAGSYTCRLIIKDATHLTGLAWDTDIILTILP